MPYFHHYLQQSGAGAGDIFHSEVSTAAPVSRLTATAHIRWVANANVKVNVKINFSSWINFGSVGINLKCVKLF